MVLQLNDALAVATTDGGPRDALQPEIEWRQEIKALLELATAAAKKITKHTLLDRSVFYVSGAHHESYGSTGHPHDILAVTDDAANNRGYAEHNRMAADPAVSRQWPCAERDQECCLRYNDGKNQRGAASLHL